MEHFSQLYDSCALLDCLGSYTRTESFRHQNSPQTIMDSKGSKLHENGCELCLPGQCMLPVRLSGCCIAERIIAQGAESRAIRVLLRIENITTPGRSSIAVQKASNKTHDAGRAEPLKRVTLEIAIARTQLSGTSHTK